jgi:hypothetical protein
MAKPKVETLPIDRLQIDPKNVRRHTERNRKAISDSLKRFKGVRSIAITGDNRIMAGNGTVTAAIESGEFHEVLVVEPQAGQIVAVRRSDLTDAEASAYAIMDNRASDLAEWHEVELAEQLESLKSTGLFEFTGFTDDDLAKIEKQIGDEILEAGEDIIPSVYEIVIECKTENEQQKIYDEMIKRGHTCRVVTL